MEPLANVTDESFFQTLFHSAADAVVIADEQGRYVAGNAAACNLLGYDQDELLDLAVEDVVARDRAWTVTEFQRFLREGRWRGELELRRKDGSVIVVDAHASVLFLQNATRYVSALRTISEQRSLERLQRNFLADVAHELRNPLTPIIGFARFLQRTQEYDEEAVATIVDYAKRMQKIVDDLVSVSILEGGGLALVREEVDLEEVVRRTLHEAETFYDKASFSFDSQGAVSAFVDPARIAQVLDNLLLNAIKYSRSQAKVAIRVEGRPDSALISVRDSGIGMDAAQLTRVFERFYRAESARTLSPSGMGIGLYVAKQIVAAHGGTIWAESEGPGKGATFFVALPLGYQSIIASPRND